MFCKSTLPATTRRWEKESPERIAASLFLRLANTIHDAMIITSGKIGYRQTPMTIFHASWVTPRVKCHDG